jgi:hypothetical protein
MTDDDKKRLQDIALRVWTHLHMQRGRAYSVNAGSCQYRTPDGKACAVGCLIADHWYTEKKANWPNNAAIRNVTDYSEFKAALREAGVDPSNQEDMSLLREFQSIHDDPESWDDDEKFIAQERYNRKLGVFNLDPIGVTDGV